MGVTWRPHRSLAVTPTPDLSPIKGGEEPPIP
jgi:hypothetical protein